MTDTEPLPTAADRRAELSAEFLRLRRDGWTVRAIAAEFGVCCATVCKYTAGHPRPSKLTAEQKAEVRRLRAGGWKLVQLAHKFGVSGCTVVRICKPDRPPPPPGILTPEQVAELRALAAAGHTQRALAERFGVSQSCVCHAVTGKTWADAGGQPVRRGSKRVLTAGQVRQMRAQLAAGCSQTELAAGFGVSPKTVAHIVHGRTWRWLT